VPFHEIMPAVRDGRVDAGLVIHEARFTYQRLRPAQARRHGRALGGDDRAADPARRDHRQALAGRGDAALARRGRSGRRYAPPGTTRRPPAYVLEHAQEMDPSVADQHIGLYVNEFTADLGEDGYAAVTGAADTRGGRGARTAPRPERTRFPLGISWRPAKIRWRSPETPYTSNWSATARSRPAILRPRSSPGSGPLSSIGRDVLQQRRQVLDDGGQFVGLLALRRGDRRRRVRITTESAWSPRCPATTPNSTRWPGLRESTPAGRTEEWTKTSPPSSRERKPKPFSLLNHLTLPVGTSVPRPRTRRKTASGCWRKTSADSTWAGRWTRRYQG
jgi:hypothetical protein